MADEATVSYTHLDVYKRQGLGSDPAAESTGFGLLGLNERARQLGGRLTIDTAPGAGYELMLTLPTKD